MANSIFNDQAQQELKEDFIKIVMETAAQLVLDKTNKRWLRKKDVLEYIHISGPTLDTWVRQGGLKLSIIGGVILFDKREIDAFVLKYQQ
ncbi:hypothetical protein CAR_c08880 [Carnobacterium sp. 17-4]|uniref:helix-turn-helix transcriptional regulator n=1 Tax=Carnobacterium sp. (strain 17-4) TaxID=208596 RepID=UPI0002058CDB|nr:helix-turn-helix domain-containing protein [Carnobacterium sp. 17-4]AEB29581.1 hypothetical protein CAR_c08880 [Carnobacterium sp. 17-4]